MNIIETIENRETALTVDELGTLLNSSPKTLYKAISAGRLPAYRIGGCIRLDPHDVAEWLRDRHTKIGIGGESPLLPSHTTGQAGPHPAVR